MSAAELLHGLQPACASSARCKPAAMGQCARGRQWWCRRDAPAHRHRHRQTRHVHLLWSRRIAHRSRQPAQPSHTRPDDMVLPHLCCRNTNSFDRGDREPQESTFRGRDDHHRAGLLRRSGHSGARRPLWVRMDVQACVMSDGLVPADPTDNTLA